MQAPGQQLLETLVTSTYEVLWVGAIILGGNGGSTVDGFNVPNKYTQRGLRFPPMGTLSHQVYILRVYKARRL